MKVVEIAGRKIGGGAPAYVVAEAGCNHNGELGLAHRLIDMAIAARADAIKFQTYHAEQLYSRQTPMMAHFRDRLGASPDATMFDLIRMTELPWELHAPICDYCRGRAIPFFSAAFEEEAVDLLETFDVPAYKIAAFEMTHFPLLRKVARTGKPVILSTGMSTLGDIEKALAAVHGEGNEQVILLHCVSNYPARPEDYNLRVIETLKAAFGCPVGLSDHTPGTRTAEIAMARGADLVEKHITIDQSLPGPDHHFSLTPEELTALVDARDEITAILGSPIKRCTSAEDPMKQIGRRSLVAAVDIPAGTPLTEEMIAVKRPGTGLHPELMDVLVGSIAQAAIAADTPLAWKMFIKYGASR